MGTATLNVRMPEELKAGGDAVLARKGKSVSDAVRDLYAYLEDNQDLPAFMKDDEATKSEELTQRRRAALKRVAGVLPADVDLDSSKQQRLSRQLQSGVRL